MIPVSLVTLMAALITARGLHFSDFRIGNSQTAATVTHHRVELMQRLSMTCLQFIHADVHFASQRPRYPLPSWAGIHAAADPGNGSVTGSPFIAHRYMPSKSPCCIGQRSWPERPCGCFHRRGHDHLTDGRNTDLLQRTCARYGTGRYLRAPNSSPAAASRGVIGVGAHFQLADACPPSSCKRPKSPEMEASTVGICFAIDVTGASRRWRSNRLL